MKTKALSLFAVPALFFPGLANAAVLSGTVTTTDLGSGVDLTATGGVNWALWNTTSNTNVNFKAPTDLKSTTITSGQSGFISNIVTAAATGTSVRGAGAATYNFSYSDGAGSTTRAAATSGMVLDSDLNDTGEGVKVTVVGNTLQTYRVDVWATGFRGTGTMTASLNNATSVVLDSQAYEEVKGPTLFSFTFRPDDLSDTLNLSYLLTTVTDGSSSHVGIQAVTVTAVPEPSAALLSAAALGLLAFRRRR